MKRSYKIATAAAAALGLGFAAAAFAHPGAMGAGMGEGMGPGMMHGGFAGPMAAQQLMTPEERTALQEKMRNAKTPEERRQIAEANRAEMHKRLAERGVAHKAPAEAEHSH